MNDSIPANLRYTKEHEWARVDGDVIVVWSQNGGEGEAVWWNRFEPENGWTGANQFPLDTLLARRPRLARSRSGAAPP